MKSSISWMAASSSISSSDKETVRSPFHLFLSSHITHQKGTCCVGTPVNCCWRHLFVASESQMTTSQLASLLAEDVFPYWPAAITWGRYHSSALHKLVYDVFGSGLSYACVGWEERKPYVAHFSPRMTVTLTKNNRTFSCCCSMHALNSAYHSGSHWLSVLSMTKAFRRPSSLAFDGTDTVNKSLSKLRLWLNISERQ